MAADAARALVHERLYAPLVLGEPETAAQVPYELEPLAILLDECMEIVEFRDAERAAEHKALRRAYDEQAAQAPTALAVELEHTQFNYALALDAVAALQPDPDATCVDGRVRPPVDDAALDTLQAEHSAALAALREEHAAALEALHAQHADTLAARTAAHDAALHTAHTQHTEALAAQAQAHSDALDAERTAHADAQQNAAHEHDSSVRALQDAHTRETEALAARHTDELHALRATHAAALDTQRAEHTARAQAWDTERAAWAQAADAAAAQRAADAERIASLSATVDALARSVQQSEVLLASVRERVDAHEAWDVQHARAYAALAERLSAEQARSEEHEAARAAAEQARDAAHEAGEAKAARAHDAERRLAELQRDVERTREVQADVAALQARAAHAEAEVAALRERAQDAEPLRVAAAQLQREVDELQTVVSMHKTSAKHAEQDHVRAEETIRELTSNVYVLEHAVRARDDELATLRDARQRHTEQIRALKAAEKAWRAERDAGGWHERIAQLELELSAKAEEVEEADTRILGALRDNKRLAAQNKALQAKLAHATAAPGGDARVAQPLADRTNRRDAPAPVSPGASPDKAGRGEAHFRDRLARFKPAT